MTHSNRKDFSTSESNEPIPFALHYHAGGEDEHFRQRVLRTLAILGVIVASIRIGSALVTGQTWLGLFLIILPKLTDARYWYSFIRGPVTLLLGVSLLIPSVLVLSNQRSAFRWIRLNEAVALISYVLMFMLNAWVGAFNLHRNSISLFISTNLNALQPLLYPLLVTMLRRSAERRSDAQ